MANVLYTPYKVNLWGGGTRVTVSSDTIKAALIDHGTVAPNTTTHDFWDDISAGLIGTATALGSKTTTAGVFDAADTTFSTVSGSSAESVTIYKDTGTPATSVLMIYLDTFSSGMPVTPNGGDIILTYNASGIATL